MGSLYTGFFRFFFVLRGIHLPVQASLRPTCHLSLENVAIDSPTNPSIMRVTLKQSKTDPFRQGMDIFLGVTKPSLCPVMAMLAYLAIRGSSVGLLFIRTNGSPADQIHSGGLTQNSPQPVWH